MPHIQAATSALTSTYNQNQPQLQAIAGQVQGQLPGLGQKAFNNSDSLNSAMSYNQSVLGGKYLSGNPHLEAMINQTRGNTADGINALFSKAGRSAGGAHTGQLALGLSNAENGLRYGDYEQERQRMGQAAGMAPGLEQAQFAGVNPYLQTAAAGAEIPFIGSNNYARGIGDLWGNAVDSSTKPGLGLLLMNAANSAASAYAGRR
jgi:hypothetical protein